MTMEKIVLNVQNFNGTVNGNVHSIVINNGVTDMSSKQVNLAQQVNAVNDDLAQQTNTAEKVANDLTKPAPFAEFIHCFVPIEHIAARLLPIANTATTKKGFVKAMAALVDEDRLFVFHDHLTNQQKADFCNQFLADFGCTNGKLLARNGFGHDDFAGVCFKALKK